jgi:hypothetical protein
MKIKSFYVLAIAIAMAFTSCRKGNEIKPALNTEENEAMSATVMAASGVPRNSVFTIAGGPYTTGPTLVNGTGRNAHFNGPVGIQLMDDGTIYVADARNNVIRKVTQAGLVSTFGIPKPGNTPLSQPKYIGITKSGTINIIATDPGEGFSEGRIYKPDGTLVILNTYFYAIFVTLAKDPYEDVFWFNSGPSTRKFLPDGSGSIGTNFLEYNNEFLPEFPESHPFFRGLFVGYNKVTYFTYNNQIYKHTPSNIGALIFPNLFFNNITCIIANKDSRTIYVADNGYIRRIDDGRLSTIAGPNNTNPDGRDGVGFKADVNAEYLALGKDESTLYFSDTKANAIRKIVLK